MDPVSALRSASDPNLPFAIDPLPTLAQPLESRWEGARCQGRPMTSLLFDHWSRGRA